MYSMQTIDAPFRIAVISTGIERTALLDVESADTEMGWSVSFQSEGLVVEQTEKDSVGQGTEIALCLAKTIPNVVLVGIDIFNGQGKTTSTLLLKALEKAVDLQCDAVLVCVQSFNSEKRSLFAKVTAYAHKRQIPIVASGVPNKVSYPAQIPTVFGVISHEDCRERMYVYDHQFFADGHPNRGCFIDNGWWQDRYVGSEVAAVHLLSKVVDLLRNGAVYEGLFEALSIRGFLPFDEFKLV